VNQSQQGQTSDAGKPSSFEGEKQQPYDEQSENEHRGSLCRKLMAREMQVGKTEKRGVKKKSGPV
jgi:hypothetical protein